MLLLIGSCQGLQSSFQMTVESNYAIAIPSLSDWLKNLALVFQPMKSKTKTNCTMYTRFFSRFGQITVLDWFIALCVPDVIGRSHQFSVGYSIRKSFENRSLQVPLFKIIYGSYRKTQVHVGRTWGVANRGLLLESPKKFWGL